jgi:hypothetical protein
VLSETEHLSGYQARDHEVVDYQMYKHPGTNLWFRGPEPGPLRSQGYFTCIGAAQTFGCFCAEPYPLLLERRLEIPSLNLGYGGAGPEFYLRHLELIHEINRGRFVIIQVMSGRSQSNSLFESGGLEYLTRRSDGRRIGANAAYGELLKGSPVLRQLWPRRLGNLIARLSAAPQVKSIIAETQANWTRSYARLIEQIKVPTILLWFSKRTPAYRQNFRSVPGLFGEFPQLVTLEMVQAVRKVCGSYAECVTERGSPQPLVSRFTELPTSVTPSADRLDLGTERWTHNRYYPSPEMHQDAANTLHGHCLQYLK